MEGQTDPVDIIPAFPVTVGSWVQGTGYGWGPLEALLAGPVRLESGPGAPEPCGGPARPQPPLASAPAGAAVRTSRVSGSQTTQHLCLHVEHQDNRAYMYGPIWTKVTNTWRLKHHSTETFPAFVKNAQTTGVA